MEVSKDKGGPAMQASASRAAAAGGQAVGGGAASGGGGNSPLEAYKTELEGFAHAVRTGEPNLCDGEVGRDAAVAMLKANEAIEKGQRIVLACDSASCGTERRRRAPQWLPLSQATSLASHPSHHFQGVRDGHAQGLGDAGMGHLPAGDVQTEPQRRVLLQ